MGFVLGGDGWSYLAKLPVGLRGADQKRNVALLVGKGARMAMDCPASHDVFGVVCRVCRLLYYPLGKPTFHTPPAILQLCVRLPRAGYRI